MIMRYLPSLLGLLLLAALVPAPVRAGLDVEFSAGIRINDDTDLYFAINSRYFDRDREHVKTVAAHYRDPDDVAVVLFISMRSGRSADYIFSLRRRSLSWSEISVKVGLPRDVWFVEMPRNPGPPYGKAYGHHKKHKKRKRHGKSTGALTDADIRNLIAVRMIHEYYGVPVETAMELRSSGRPLATIMSTEYHKRHGRPGGSKHGSESHGDHPGKGHGKKR